MFRRIVAVCTKIGALILRGYFCAEHMCESQRILGIVQGLICRFASRVSQRVRQGTSEASIATKPTAPRITRRSRTSCRDRRERDAKPKRSGFRYALDGMPPFTEFLR